MNRADRLYLFITGFLVIAAIAGGLTLALEHRKSQPMELALCQVEPPQQSGQLYIGGAVANPGVYTLRANDTIQAVLLSAGIEPGADFSQMKLHVPREGESELPQRIDINRAHPWLLQALPGIGEARAQAIVAYRTEQGPFRRIEDLLGVSGIGPATFDNLKDYITVSD